MAVGKDSVKRAVNKSASAEVKPIIENNVVIIPIKELKYKSVKNCASVKKSIKEVGVILPIVAVKNGDILKVVDGAKRLSALSSLGADSVKAVIIDGDEKKVKKALNSVEETAVKPEDVKTDEIREAKFEVVRRVTELPTYLL